MFKERTSLPTVPGADNSHNRRGRPVTLYVLEIARDRTAGADTLPLLVHGIDGDGG